MSGKREIACGVDVHNQFIVATILSSDGLKLQDRFDTNLEELLKFKDWLKENGCHKVALESTIFCRDHRELRSLTRTRESLIKVRTKIKNKVTYELEAACIKLSSVLS